MDAELSNLLYLWPRRTLFIGRVTQPIQFSQAAASLVVGVRSPLIAHSTEGEGTQRLNSHCLLLAPGKKIVVDGSGDLVAACYLDALGQDYRFLAERMTQVLDGVYGDFPDEPALRHFLTDLHRSPRTQAEAYGALEAVINPGQSAYPGGDPRIEKVIQLIKDNITTNVSAEELAREVNLSVSRLVELFRGQVGVPIRRYRQWHRLFVTFTGVQQGESLTNAAIAAGFTDSAHFSHTFRMTLGMTPSDILAMLSGRIYVDSDQADTPEQTPGYQSSGEIAR